MQERRNSIANALELRLSCISPSICYKGMQLVPSHLDRSDHVIAGLDRSSLVILSAFFPYWLPSINVTVIGASNAPGNEMQNL